MFTYVNSAKDRMYFNVELRKVALLPLKDHPNLRMVRLILGQHNERAHEVDLGLYHLHAELLKGLATIDEWGRGREYVTLDTLRQRLKDSFSSSPLTITEEIKEMDDDDRTK